MNVKIIPSAEFNRRFKRLAKKYKSLVDDYLTLSKELKENPFQGTDLGGGVRKIRMAIASKGKGKSGGARVITHTVLVATYGADITLVTIYDKSDQESISNKELRQLMKKNGLE